MLKDNDLSILYHPSKANVVVHTLNKKALHMGDLGHPFSLRVIDGLTHLFLSQQVDSILYFRPYKGYSSVKARSTLLEQIQGQ